MGQLDIFDICARNHGGNAESIEANKRASSNKARHRAEILAYIKNQSAAGATCWELEVALGIAHQSCSARCSELKAEGLIVPSGEKRRTQTGSKAAVLVINEKGEIEA